MVGGDEHRDLIMLECEGRHHVGAPYRVDGLRYERAVVAARAAGSAGRALAWSTVLAHLAAHPLLRRPQAMWRSRARTLR
jgi:hypothetical protein